MSPFYKDRAEAGRQLAKLLAKYRGDKNAAIIGLPRGGVIIADEVAKALHLPLNLIITRKIGFPGHEEYAIGAVTEYGEAIWSDAKQQISTQQAHAAYQEALQETRRRKALYLEHLPPLEVKGKTVIVVDDGLATGLTMQAALMTLQKLHPQQIIVAIPVAAPDSVIKLKPLADEILALQTPQHFAAVGAHYDSFLPVSDQEVQQIMQHYRS